MSDHVKTLERLVQKWNFTGEGSTTGPYYNEADAICAVLEEIERLKRQLTKVARIAGIDLAELDEDEKGEKP